MNGGLTWACPCGMFPQYSAGVCRQEDFTVETLLEVPASRGWGDEVVKSEGLCVMDVTFCFFGNPLFYSDIRFEVVYAIMILSSEHAKTFTPGVNGGRWWL